MGSTSIQGYWLASGCSPANAVSSRELLISRRLLSGLFAISCL